MYFLFSSRYVQLSSGNGDDGNNLVTTECYYGTTASDRPYQLEIAGLAAEGPSFINNPILLVWRTF